MKTLLLLALLPSLSYAATEARYECGNEAAYPVTLEIRKAKRGSFYELEGTLKAPGKDSTTGTFLRSKETRLEGSRETIDGRKVYQMVDVSEPRRQVFAEIKRVGAKAKVSVLTLTGANSADENVRDCKVSE